MSADDQRGLNPPRHNIRCGACVQASNSWGQMRGEAIATRSNEGQTPVIGIARDVMPPISREKTVELRGLEPLTPTLPV